MGSPANPMKPSILRNRVLEIFWQRFSETTGYETDEKGYVSTLEQNLLPGVTPEMFQQDLEQGSGNELQGKFLAVHSSSALVVNTFAPFKMEPGTLHLAGCKGFEKIKFERQCPTGLGGTPPNLDVVAENDTEIFAVESKFLEYLTPKKPYFAKSYCRENLPQAEECWLEAISKLSSYDKQYLDSAQLVKHYLGIRNQPEFRKKKIILLYLYWEPENWSEFEIFRQHKSEIDEFAKQVAHSAVKFISQSYPELWNDLNVDVRTQDHTSNLLKRYKIRI